MTCPVLATYAAAVLTWGAQTNASSVTLRPAEPPAVAEVVFVNTVTTGSPMPFNLTLGPLTVRVAIEHAPGAEPEVLEVEAPEGFVAAPAAVVEPDWATTTVQIFCAEDMGMG